MDSNKLWLIVCGMLLWGAINGSAQEQDTSSLRHEVAFGFGIPSGIDMLATIASGGDYSPGPEIHAQYLYNVSKHVGLGVLGVFEYYRTSDKSSHGTLLSINPTARFYWFNHKHFAMYSKVGAGVLFGFEDGVEAIPMINVSLVGMEFGGKRWRGFTELFPIGTMGFLNIGIKHSF